MMTQTVINKTASDQHARLEWHLENWARWMRNSGFHLMDCPSRSPIIGVSHGADFDQIYEEVTRQTAEAVNGCVESLGRAEQAALRCGYLDEVWRYSQPVELMLVLAREAVQVVMNKRGIA